MEISNKVLFDVGIMKNLETFIKLSEKVTNLSETRNFCIRSLELDDFDKNYMKLLSELTVTGTVSKTMFRDKFLHMKACPNTYNILVIEDCSSREVIASVTLLIEHKFIRQASKRGRIEDVVICKEFRSFGLGHLMVATMKELAIQLGCYKLTLECADDNVEFYKKNGFITEKNQNYMSIKF